MFVTGKVGVAARFVIIQDPVDIEGAEAAQDRQWAHVEIWHPSGGEVNTYAVSPLSSTGTARHEAGSAIWSASTARTSSRVMGAVNRSTLTPTLGL